MCRITLPVFDSLVIESSVSDVFYLPYRLSSLLIYRNSFGVNAIINSNKICIRYNIKKNTNLIRNP